MEIEVTQLPCGRGCGAVHTMPGLVKPLAIQRAALAGGWWVMEVEGQEVLVCPNCKTEADSRFHA